MSIGGSGGLYGGKRGGRCPLSPSATDLDGCKDGVDRSIPCEIGKFNINAFGVCLIKSVGLDQSVAASLSPRDLPEAL